MRMHSTQPRRHHRVGRTPMSAIAACMTVAMMMILSTSCGGVGYGHTLTVNARYPNAAPLEQYRSTSRASEIALARSAAPPSISAQAEVLVLGEHGYETAVKGTNGFVCMVERSWDAGFDDLEFWNPKIRGPNCFNATAARTQLPQFLKRAEWALAGATRPEMIERTRAAFATHAFERPASGAVSYMLSKGGYLSDDGGGPWLPHIMIFVPHGQAAAWGAGADGAPILGKDGSDIESTVLLIPVRRWSDGSPAQPLDQLLPR